MEELLNKELTYGQLTRGVLKEEPKKNMKINILKFLIKKVEHIHTTLVKIYTICLRLCSTLEKEE